MATPSTRAQSDTPLEQVSMEWARERILKNLFRRFDGSRPELQARLEEAYKKKFGVPIRRVTQRDVRAIYLESPPGHGKTTTHRAACREFAQLMGMRFLDDPSMKDMAGGAIDENCFVFSTVNLGGATSKHEIGGLMAKLKVGNQEFMGHLPDWRLAATMMAGFGYVLFDDYVTSSHQVQNACLDLLLGGSAGDMQFNAKDLASSRLKLEGGQVVMEADAERAAAIEKAEGERHVRGCSPVHLGLAGNRGLRDGNKTFPITTATATRIERFDVFDTPEAFIERALNKHTDEIGDAHYSLFIKQHPELFTIVAKPHQGILPQMPSPRSHDALMDSIADVIYEHGGMGAIAFNESARREVIRDIERMAGGIIGKQIVLDGKDAKGGAQVLNPGSAVAAFYEDMFLGAVPLAESVIKRGEIDEETIKAKYNNGAEGDGMNFGYRFASALAQLAASTISERVKKAGKDPIKQLSDPESPLSKDVRVTLSRLSMGVSFLSKVFASFALDRFNTRLNAVCPEIYEGTTYKILPTETIRTVMLGLVKDNTRYNTRELQETFVDAISQSAARINQDFNGGRDKTINQALASRKDAARKAMSNL